MDIPFEGLESSSSDWSSLAMVSVEYEELSEPPAPDRSPGVIYPSDETTDEPRVVVPIRKEQVSPVLYKNEPSEPVTPPYPPHVYDTPDTAESTRYPICVGLVVWTVDDDESESPQAESNKAAATRERERDGNLNGWLSFAGISCDGGLIGNGKWKIDNEKWKVENFCAFSVF